MNRRRICVVTGTRAEYGLLHWIMREIQDDPELELQILATCMHLSPEFGMTVGQIEADGFSIASRVEMLLSSDTASGVTKSMGVGLIGYGDAFTNLSPDLVLLLGDRFELLAAATAAMIARIPIAHISGGEVTSGAVDDSIRHAITKMATFHFPANDIYCERIIRMGEHPDYVLNFGDPGLDNLHRLKLLSRGEFESSLHFSLRHPTFLVTYHPATLGHLAPEQALTELLAALDHFPDASILISKPNADAGGRILAQMLDDYGSRNRGRALVVSSLGQLRYLSAMTHCDVVVGNSSSGLTEAPALKKPSVNIGDRQKGRLRAASVIDCPERCGAIVSAIQLALSPEFLVRVAGAESHYRSDDSSNRIVRYLKQADLGHIKEFYDPPPQQVIHCGGEQEVPPQLLEAAPRAHVAADPMPYSLLVDTGRSALLLALEDILRRNGNRIAYLPSYCCESARLPFLRLGFDLYSYGMGPDLRTPAGLPSELDGATILYIHYFGHRNVAMEQWLTRQRAESSFFVIEDCVQSAYTTGVGSFGDYSFTSLRKFNPQPDGALLCSRTPLPDRPLAEPDESFISQKLIGKILRSQWAQSELDLELFRLAEERLNAVLEPRRISCASKYLMERLDVDGLKQSRRDNWNHLASALHSLHSPLVESLNAVLTAEEVPLGYPVLVAGGMRDSLKHYLCDHGVYSAVHWPMGRLWAGSSDHDAVSLSGKLLTLPIDQRLSAAIIDKMIDNIASFPAEG